MLFVNHRGEDILPLVRRGNGKFNTLSEINKKGLLLGRD